MKVLMLLMFCCFPMPILAAQKGASIDPAVNPNNTSISSVKTIENLHWGEVLFYAFKDEKYQALIHLEARAKQNNLQPHQQQAQIFAAALLLDLGLPSVAEKRIQQIPPLLLSNALHSQLALAMARVFFAHQDYSAAKSWLNQAKDSELNFSDRQIKGLLQAKLYFNKAQYYQAAELLTKIHDKGNLRHYAEYNNGLTLLYFKDKKSHIEGKQLLQKVADLEPDDQEQYALKDQAKLALGLEALKRGEAFEAREHLLGIRQQGLVSNDAILALGWSFSEAKFYEKALGYWDILFKQDDILDPRIQESWLAVPYAHQQLGDLQGAMDGYLDARSKQQQAQKLLQQKLQQQDWRELLVQSPKEGTSSFQQQLRANPNFYNWWQRWQDIHHWQQRLDRLAQSIPTLNMMLENNKVQYLEKLKKVEIFLQENSPQDFQQKYQDLNNLFQQQKVLEIADKILPEQQSKLWHKILETKSFIDNHPDDVNQDQKQKFKLLQGIFKWKIQRQQQENLWLSDNSLMHLKIQLDQFNQTTQQVNKTVINTQNNPYQIQQLEIEKLHNQLLQLSQKIQTLKSALEEQMEKEYLGIIDEKILALTQLGKQADLAIARLTFSSVNTNSKDFKKSEMKISEGENE